MDRMVQGKSWNTYKSPSWQVASLLEPPAQKLYDRWSDHMPIKQHEDGQLKAYTANVEDYGAEVDGTKNSQEWVHVGSGRRPSGRLAGVIGFVR
jgi:hypothetical protein